MSAAVGAELAAELAVDAAALQVARRAWAESPRPVVSLADVVPAPAIAALRAAVLAGDDHWLADRWRWRRAPAGAAEAPAIAPVLAAVVALARELVDLAPDTSGITSPWLGVGLDRGHYQLLAGDRPPSHRAIEIVVDVSEPAATGGGELCWCDGRGDGNQVWAAVAPRPGSVVLATRRPGEGRYQRYRDARSTGWVVRWITSLAAT